MVEREFIDYKTSMITDEDPLCSTRISVSLTHYTFLKNGDGGASTPISGERAAPFPRDLGCLMLSNEHEIAWRGSGGHTWIEPERENPGSLTVRMISTT